MALLLFGVDVVLVLGLGYLLRITVKQCIQSIRYDLVDEIISTFELSACIYEIGVLGRAYGVAASFICLFCLLLAKNYNVIFHGRPANPCGIIEDVFHQSTSKRYLFVIWFCQLFGALLAYPYISIVWRLNQSSFHLIHLENGFQPELKVGVFSGFMIELFATFCSQIVDLATRIKPYDSINPWVRTITCVALGYFMAETTGVWMNPALATAHSFHYNNDFVLQHIFVYWLGPLFGVVLAIICNLVIENSALKKGGRNKGD